MTHWSRVTTDDINPQFVRFAEALGQISRGERKQSIEKLTGLIDDLKSDAIKGEVPTSSKSRTDDVQPLLYTTTECGGLRRRLLVEALTVRGIIYSDLKNSSSSLADLAKVSRLCPTFSRVHAALAYAFNTAGKADDAIKSANRAIELDANLGLAYVERARAYKKIGKVKEAKDDETRANAIETENKQKAEVWRKVYMQSVKDGVLDKRNQTAVTIAVKKALKLSPRNFETLRAYDTLQLISGNAQKTIEVANILVGLEPNNVNALQMRVSGLLKEYDYANALRDNDASLKIDPHNFMALSNKPSILMEMGRHEEALLAFDQALNEFPKTAALYVNRAAIFTSMNKPQLAVEDAKKAIALDPSKTFTYHALGFALARLGRWKETKIAMETALERSRQYTMDVYGLASCHYYRGLALKNLGEPEQAKKEYDQALLIEPKLPKMYLGYAINYPACSFDLEFRKNGAKATSKTIELAQRFHDDGVLDAIQLYSRMIEQSPTRNPEIGSRAIAYVTVGKPKEAIQDLEKLLNTTDALKPSTTAALYFVCNEQLGDRKSGETLIKKALHRGTDDDMLLRYLLGSVSEQDYLAAQRNESRISVAHYFMAKHLLNIGKTAEAKKHLDWVIFNARPTTNEYFLSVADLKRMKK